MEHDDMVVYGDDSKKFREIVNNVPLAHEPAQSLLTGPPDSEATAFKTPNVIGPLTGKEPQCVVVICGIERSEIKATTPPDGW